MTQDEIIRMAREAGMTVFVTESLERFFNLAFAAGAAHEREKQAEQEPVAYVLWGDNNVPSLQWEKPNDGVFNELYYAAPVRTKDLTDDEIEALANQRKGYMKFARAVIAADREKNNGTT